MNDSIADILTVYRDLDARIARFQTATGLSCPGGCGSCCENRNVEATLLEILPMAKTILSSKSDGAFFQMLEALTRESASPCVLYRPDRATPGQGRCAFYEYRPLVCRLFGFAVRRDRKSALEPCLCGRIKCLHPQAKDRLTIAFLQGYLPPTYQDSFMRIASMHPEFGAKLRPINTALREGLEYLYSKTHHILDTAA